MIAYLEGTIIDIREKSLVLLTRNGVGYEVAVSDSIIGDSIAGKIMSLWTAFIVRENAHELFGFQEPSAVRLFHKLTSVSGVGPRLGLTLMNHLNPTDLIGAIEHRDIALLSTIPGVGKKTAEKIAVSLSGSLKDFITEDHLGQSSQGKSDLIDALSSLGYSPQQIRTTLEYITEDTIENQITQALKLLS